MPSLFQALAQMKGHNDPEGGPTATIDPETGEQVFAYSPYKAKGGFLSRWGQGKSRAAELNAEIGGKAFLGQEEGKRRIKELGEGGKQDRLTNAEKAKLESMLGKEKFEQLMQEIETKQRASVMEKDGVPYSKENSEVFSKALSDPRIRNALLGARNEEAVLASPQVRDSAITGTVQQNLSPLFMNEARSAIQASPNSVGTFRELSSGNPLGARRRIQGNKEVNTISQTGGIPYTDKTTGETSMMGGKTTATRGYDNSGGVFPMADPKLLEAAAGMSDPSTNGVMATPGSMEGEEIQKLMMLLKKYPQILQQMNPGGGDY